jgi:UDP-N-acetylglucosamine 2-epimerase
VKIAPVVEALRDAGVKVHTLATGQHDDPGLADALFSDLARTRSPLDAAE